MRFLCWPQTDFVVCQQIACEHQEERQIVGGPDGKHQEAMPPEQQSGTSDKIPIAIEQKHQSGRPEDSPEEEPDQPADFVPDGSPSKRPETSRAS